MILEVILERLRTRERQAMGLKYSRLRPLLLQQGISQQPIS